MSNHQTEQFNEHQDEVREDKMCPDWCGHEDICSSKKHQEFQPHETEEWGGWKIVSDMLDRPGENGIYKTSECYQKLYDFVVSQKRKAIEGEQKKCQRLAKTITGLSAWEERQRIIKIVKTNEYPYMMPETEKRFLEDIN